MKGILTLVLFLFGSLSQSEERSGEGIGLTIYSKPSQGRYRESHGGYAIVNEWRRLDLKFQRIKRQGLLIL